MSTFISAWGSGSSAVAAAAVGEELVKEVSRTRRRAVKMWLRGSAVQEAAA